MAKAVVNDGETGLVVRGKINDNFTELYGSWALTANRTITQAGFNTTYSGIGKVTFSPTTGASSVAGLNVGSIAGNPTGFADGDLWYNSSASNYTGRVASATVAFMWFNTGAGDLVTTRVPYISATSGRFSSSSNFTFASSRLKTWLTLAAGTATAGTAPLKFTSGTNLTTAEAGAMEYNGTNLFFTRAGTTREGVLTQSAVTTEVIVSDTSVTVNIGGTTYKLLARA